MRRFAAGEIDVLVATSVIEVGIDVAERDGDGGRGRPSATGSRSSTSSAAGSAAASTSRSASSSATRKAREAAQGAARGDRDRARRLQARRGGPLDPRRGRAARHPPARAAALPRGARCPTTWRCCSRPATRSRGLLERHGSLEAPALGPADGRGAPALRRRARRADRAPEPARMAELRVTGGELGGRRIEAPPRRGKTTSGRRPSGSARRSSRSSATSSGARVLDLFCGTGALGDRGALARGGRGDPRGHRARPRAAQRRGASSSATARRSSGRTPLKFLDRAPEGSFDLVLCDPPYGLADRSRPSLDPLIRRALAPGGRVMVESSPENPIEIDAAARARAPLRRHAGPRAPRARRAA